MCRLLASKTVKPVAYPTVYPLEKLVDGLTALEGRQTWGKVIVRVKEENVGAKL